MTDDEPAAPESGKTPVDAEYKPYGALFVTIVLGAVILGFWALMFVLAQLRG